MHYGGKPVFAGRRCRSGDPGPGANRLDRTQRSRQINAVAADQRAIGSGRTARPGEPTGAFAYLSQRLDLLDLNSTVYQNLVAFAPAMADAKRMHLLARFLFRGPRIHLPVRVLSGGERLRATLACILFAEPAPQLLLLDEPTNNLDLVSVGQLEAAIAAYQGAFVVVSHDERFLSEINVNRLSCNCRTECLRRPGGRPRLPSRRAAGAGEGHRS